MEPNLRNANPESKNEPASVGGRISEGLDRLEVLVGKIGMNSAEASREMLIAIDSLTGQIDSLEGKVSKKTAQGQLGSILSKLQKEARPFLKDLGGAEALRTLRSTQQPPVPADRWWWFLDEMVNTQRKLNWKRTLFAVVGVGIGLLIVVLIYRLFLAPDPELLAIYQREQNARAYMEAGELDQALSETNQGLQVDPQNPPLLILKGVILQKQGDTAQAEQVFSQAESVTASQEEFYEIRGGSYLLIGDYDAAIHDANQMAQINPQSAQAYMIMGQANELKQNFTQAIDDYGRAFDLAEEQDLPSIAAVARFRTGVVLQAMNNQILMETPSVTP